MAKKVEMELLRFISKRKSKIIFKNMLYNRNLIE
jgi:hypothetical protein